jgi:golgin subfamily B member 1
MVFEGMPEINKMKITEKEYQQIDHFYIYLLVKKSPFKQNAIYDLEVVMADENVGPAEYVADNWKALGVPIQQYRGVREKTKTIPYICFKQTLDEF